MQRAQRVRPAVSVQRRPEPAQAVVPVASPVREAGSAEIITGVAFGMPRIGLPGASTSGWTSPPAAHDVAPPSTPAMLLAQSSRERAMREAALAQIADAAQRMLADTSIASAGAADGRCLLMIETDARLVCDDESLAQALAPREAALSGLLQAYRRMAPSAGALAVTLVQGRYQLSWDVRSDGPRQPGATAPGS